MPLFAAKRASVTLLHFSDYHSHALPFYSEERAEQGGIARAIGYLRREKQHGALVFSGGDMVNKGAPAWSDKYQCAEWPWFNGILDAMAFGNHDADYGRDAFDSCKAKLRYPILSANTEGFQKTALFTRGGIRIGVFALAGADFKTLVKVPFTYGDHVAAAREAVRHLREDEHADAVVMIGHEHEDDDAALARSVPGIDLIFGSHTHLEKELAKIDGSETWYVSPYQYLTYVSRVVLSFDGHKLDSVRGGLVRVDGQLPLDRPIAKRVDDMERELEHDPQYASLFALAGTLRSPLPEALLGTRTVEIMRDAVHADAGISTASSFRQPLPPGAITHELLRNALPYDNDIVVVELRGDMLEKVIERGKGAGEPLVVVAPPLDATRVYRVAITDYLANVAASYRDLFAGIAAQRSGFRVREELRKWLAAQR